MTKAIIRHRPSLQLLKPHEQLEDLQQFGSAEWEGHTVLIILDNGFQMMGTVIKVSDTHVMTDNGTIKKEQISFVRIMQAEEIRIRRGRNP